MGSTQFYCNWNVQEEDLGPFLVNVQNNKRYIEKGKDGEGSVFITNKKNIPCAIASSEVL